MIEVIMAIVVISIIMIPIAMIAMEYVRSTAYADSVTSAANLGRREMAIINDTDYAALSSDSFPNYAGSDFDLTREVAPLPDFGNAVKKTVVTVSRHGSTEKLVELAAYAMNVSFGAGGAARAAFFSASGGSFASPNRLSNITMQNTNTTDEIIMVGVLMTLNAANTLNSVTMDGATKYTGSLSIPANAETQVSFQNNFAMAPSTTYSGAQGAAFTFGGNFKKNNNIKVAFVFSDGSQSAQYTWTYR